MNNNTVYSYNKKTGSKQSTTRNSSFHNDWKKDSNTKVFNSVAERDKWCKEHK